MGRPKRKKLEAAPLLPLANDDIKEERVVKMKRQHFPKQQKEDAFKKFAIGKRPTGTKIIINDTVILLAETLQLLAIIQVLSFRWVWPIDYLHYANFVLVFNLDIWGMSTIWTNGVYKSVQGRYIPSANIPVSHNYILLAWVSVIAAILLIFFIVSRIIKFRKDPYMFSHISNLKRAFIIIIQLLALPVGTALGRLFHCNSDGNVDVDNTVKCLSGQHWALIVPANIFLLVLFIGLPWWLIIKTRKEVIGVTNHQHEAYLQLKEIEFTQGLDLVWIIQGFHIFSSFRRASIHHRAIIHFCKFIIILFYTFLSDKMFIQSCVITGVLFLMVVGMTIARPYRTSCFNSILVISYLILTADAFTGTMQTSFDAYTIQTSWLLPQYLTYVLLFLHGFLFVAWLVFTLYISSRQGCCGACGDTQIWPSMTSDSLTRLTPETRKFIIALLEGRQIVEKCLHTPPLFSPAHKLSHHIQVVNAYCREAEFLRDAFQDSLSDLLDEMLEVHSFVMPHSLFGETMKASVHQTANEFMEIMPAFKERLTQREYDFILVSPVRKRLLLKMFCVAVLMKGRRNVRRRDELNKKTLRFLWEDPPHDRQMEDIHSTALYPYSMDLPLCRPDPGLCVGQQTSQTRGPRPDILSILPARQTERRTDNNLTTQSRTSIRLGGVTTDETDDDADDVTFDTSSRITVREMTPVHVNADLLDEHTHRNLDVLVNLEDFKSESSLA